ncbi:platelet-activating factor acetylhydrolase [Bisporella sp. PMI_857]|nr:platelet-activating factor acetylhydrolase [Bisporella sp. PMI_857]
MSSFLSRFSPVPGFPAYTGPHKVGTLDVELPVSSLKSPSFAPSSDISTVQYRVFYPCEPDVKAKPINWIPAPQRAYVSAYSRFLGAGSYLAEFISYIPRILHYISIPVLKNAPLLAPQTLNKRWPVMIFSHGLAGSRNAYSHLAGSIASHGVVVIAIEHRDGSTPVTYVRAVPTATTGENAAPQSTKRTIDYRRLSHTPSPEVEDGRNEQLRIRLWEMGLVHDSLLKVAQGTELPNLNASSVSLSMFKEKIDVFTPGKITFAGHSFGAATVTQFVKSTFYSSQTSQAPKEFKPLFTPPSDSSIVQQITPNTPVVLLDVWCFPLRTASTRWLWNKPFPCYAPGGPDGAALLAVESQAFFKWRVHLKATKQLLSHDPSSSEVFPPSSSKPHFYYATSSAHLSQSDFGILFPRVIKRFLGVEDPERIMRLNVRAVLQLLRDQGIEVSATSSADMELEGNGAETHDDRLIFRRNEEIKGWNWLSTSLEDMGDVNEKKSEKDETKFSDSDLKQDPSEVVVKNEVMKRESSL